MQRRIWRILFKWSDSISQEIDVEADYISSAINQAIQFLTKRGMSYTIDHVVEAKIISEPIAIQTVQVNG